MGHGSLRQGTIDSFRTRFPAESKKTIVSGTSVFFIQKPPLVDSGKTKSMPSLGARVRFMSPRERSSDVFATSGLNVTPSSRSTAVARSVAAAPLATTATPASKRATTRIRPRFTSDRVGKARGLLFVTPETVDLPSR
jgi:hypothetical protein